jgi:hypothetical protein
MSSTTDAQNAELAATKIVEELQSKGYDPKSVKAAKICTRMIRLSNTRRL